MNSPVLQGKTLKDIMSEEYDFFLKPYIDYNVPFCLSIAPTKAFRTFQLRPHAMLVVYCPKEKMTAKIKELLDLAMRSWGDAFQYPSTVCFYKAFLESYTALLNDHEESLLRAAIANRKWKVYTSGTALGSLFGDQHSGIFRNFQISKEGAIYIYNNHLYPVITISPNGEVWCRINTTGIPDDEEAAKADVEIELKSC